MAVAVAAAKRHLLIHSTDSISTEAEKGKEKKKEKRKQEKPQVKAQWSTAAKVDAESEI